MKVLTGWKIIELFAELREATGKTQLCTRRYKLGEISNMFIYTWHKAKIGTIKIKENVNH